MATLFVTRNLEQLGQITQSSISLFYLAAARLSGGRRWEILDARVCGGVWEGWRPVPAQRPTAFSSSSVLLTSVHPTPGHIYSDLCMTANKPEQSSAPFSKTAMLHWRMFFLFFCFLFSFVVNCWHYRSQKWAQVSLIRYTVVIKNKAKLDFTPQALALHKKELASPLLKWWTWE